MDAKSILVPVDFTTASEQAVAQSVEIARKANLTISLLHILKKNHEDLPGSKLAEDHDPERKLQRLSSEISRNQKVPCDYKVIPGNIFSDISAIANADGSIFVAIGTHGIQGLKQKLLGADILKIVRKIAVPCLIVREDCVNRDFNPIVFPVGGHDTFVTLIEATALMASLFGSEVHIYSITRKGDEGTKKLKENIVLAERIFTERNIPFKRIKEETNIFSVGYAKQTLQYADQVKAGLLSIMSVKTDEHYYFAQADKESLINNEFGIPVICSSGAVKD